MTPSKNSLELHINFCCKIHQIWHILKPWLVPLLNSVACLRMQLIHGHLRHSLYIGRVYYVQKVYKCEGLVFYRGRVHWDSKGILSKINCTVCREKVSEVQNKLS